MCILSVFHTFAKINGMNREDNRELELDEVDAADIGRYHRVVHLEKNGFLLCKQGRITLGMDDKEFDLHAGELYIYPAFSQTVVLRYSNDLKATIGMADFDFSFSSLESVSDTRSLVYIRFNPVVRLTDEQYRRIEELIGLVRQRQVGASVIGRQVVAALVQAFCFEVLDAYIANHPIGQEKTTHKDNIFRKFLVALYGNFCTRRSVEFYARELCLSPRYFATLIRERSGKTPAEWISMFVIAEAKRRLSEPQASIKEIAMALNFPSQSLFGRYFKLYAGMSPSAYRVSVHVPDK